MADVFKGDLAFAKVVETPEGPALLVGYRVIRVQGLKDDSELDAICRALRGSADAEIAGVGLQGASDAIVRAARGISSGRG
ncbi:hypothetical protein [Paracoccus versutus]|uniref:Uncharacterized protein n=1 Tax=Paracoccus versutus TaxID=34007 RepID=A0A3D9XPK7_PARVE|nr:hypothetical protein [Paracoccus versutus]REF72377.1 hypothetical protein BDD41_0847 [Paracoccus versutus]WGR55646.1 hypothetical protein E3U25_06610 [Paracoccus versutus]